MPLELKFAARIRKTSPFEYTSICLHLHAPIGVARAESVTYFLDCRCGQSNWAIRRPIAVPVRS
jgi:hypothetical protein